MIHRNYIFIYLLLSLTSIGTCAPQNIQTFDNYRQPNEVNKLLKFWSAKYPKLVKAIEIGKSAGKNELLILRIAAQPGSGVDPDSRQAVFVSANIEGFHLIGTEAALMLSEKLLTGYGSDEKITHLLENKTVYVAPLLNPDAAECFFNEDPLGGININRNFPYCSQQTLSESGSLPAPVKETIVIVKFLTDFPNIALVLNFSFEKTIFNLQGGNSEAVYDKIKLPENLTKSLKLNPDLDFSVQELAAIIKSKNILPTGTVVDEDLVQKFLDLALALSVDEEDRSFLEAIQKEYKQKPGKAGLNFSAKRIEGINPSSFVAFCYFQSGVPVISSDSFDTDFYIELLNHLAELKIKDITVKSIGDDLYNVVASFVNQGWFPTSTAQGRNARISKPITVRLKTTKNQMIYSGQPFQEIPFISERGEIKELSWTIKGKRGSTVLLTAGSPKTGYVKTIFELK